MQEMVERKVNSLNSPNTISVSSSISSNLRSDPSYELPNANSPEFLHEPPCLETLQNSRISDESLEISIKINGNDSSHIRIENMEEKIKQTCKTQKIKGECFQKKVFAEKDKSERNTYIKSS